MYDKQLVSCQSRSTTIVVLDITTQNGRNKLLTTNGSYSLQNLSKYLS